MVAKKAVVRPEDALEIRQVGDPRQSPDGSRVAFVVTDLDGASKEYRLHLWMVSDTGGDARQLTFQGKRNTEPRWSPDGTTLAFVSDRIFGDEEEAKGQIWLLPADGGEARRLTAMVGGVQGIQ